ncbi:ACBP-domain-containing protein [Serendipita vermifera]|nr:ACBP-domain-containing protein [Serendipita vermifera]
MADEQDLIDLQFDRAVEMVQGLPKNGPIQTGYEEKLAMYSLYKQATVGNVQTPRPGMFDMLGRAKYDAWAKQKDLGTREAKWQYVQTLMKVLRKYSDKTIARDLVTELESYGDPSAVVMSGTLSRSDTGTSSEGSEASDDRPQHTGKDIDEEYDDVQESSPTQERVTSDDEAGERHDGYPANLNPYNHNPEIRRPGSVSSSQNRYRTPMGGSSVFPGNGSNVAVNNINMPIPTGTPTMQPLPEHPTPSAFDPSHSSSPPLPLGNQLSGGSQRSLSPYRPASVSASNAGRLQHQTSAAFRGTPSFQRNFAPGQQHRLQIQPERPTLERAVESMQASLAALHERLEALENTLSYSTSIGTGLPAGSRTSIVSHGRNSSSPNGGRRGGGASPTHGGTAGASWDPSNMGLWSLVLRPLTRVEHNFRELFHFLIHSDDESGNELVSFGMRRKERSPILLVVRRLFLDLSFIICCLIVLKSIWRKTQLRRRDVYLALGEVWRAILGQKKPRVMVSTGV